jgi:hypothetical protein
MYRALLAGRAGLAKCFCVQRAPELVGREEAHAPVADERRRAGHGVEDALHAGSDPLLGRSPTSRRGRVGRACKIGQMRALGLVELQRAGQRLQHAVGHAVDVAALQPRVVVDAHPGEQRDLLAAQAGYPPLASVDGQARPVGRDPAAP